MGQRADAIASHIREQREELDDNIRELQTKVKRTFDWRLQVRRNPVQAIGIAAGVGFLLAFVLRR